MKDKFTEEYLGTPWTFENSENPYIMDNKKIPNDIIKDKNGNPITAKYLWGLNKEQRIDCLEYVFNYLRNTGFPYPELSDEEIENELEKIRKFDSNKVLRPDNLISNSNNVGLKLCQLICKEEYFSAKGDIGTKSLIEIFENDETLIKVLKNRMGWNRSSEDGTIRPYMFPITKSQIRNGIRNSGLGYAVSNFRPSIAKFIYNKYLKKGDKIFDYSCGWGARALAAQDYTYIGVDPLTANKINLFFAKYNTKQRVICYQHGSEEFEPDLENYVDMCMSCPPYFTLERYSEDYTQSYNKFNQYQDWLEYYWRPTVENCYKYLKENGYFVLVIKENHGKFNLKEDMCKIVEQTGLKFVEEFTIFNSKNHLSGKRKSGKTTKQSEFVCVFKK